MRPASWTAQRANRPRSAPSVVSVRAWVGGGAWVGAGVSRARASRALRAEGDRRMASVVGDADVTELHARLIPEDSRYGGLVLRRFDEYTAGLRTLTELGNEVRSIPESDYNRRASKERLTAYRDQALELDNLDDVIADTAAFLGRERLWREAWDRQEAPVRADLEGVDAMLRDDVPAEGRGLVEAQSVREYATAGLALLDQLRTQLEQEQISPDDALDELKRTRDGLSGRLDALASAVVAFFPAGEALYDVLVALAKQGLVLTLFLIGAGLSRATLRTVGTRPLVQGVLLWLAVAGASLAAILTWTP